MPELETVDLEGVEILSVGGPIHGVGSPPEGDHWTPEQLREIADANLDLAEEIKPPSKIGHSKSSDPAVGWLSNIRVSDDGQKLLSDIKQVPRKFADLVGRGAWRHRSVELSRVTSQKTGRTHDWAVTGLAWLGAKLPAVSTLDDVVKLYEDGDGIERRFVDVTDEKQDFAERAFDVLVELAAREAPGVSDPSSDSRPGMPKFTDEQRRKFAEATGLEAVKVTDELLGKAGLVGEQPAPVVSDAEAQEIAKTLDVEGEVTGAKLLEAAKKAAEDGDEGGGDGDEATKALERRLEAAEKTANETKEELRLEHRRAFVEAALKTGKVTPGQRETLEALYDSNAVAARKFVDEAPANDELGREYGSADEPADDEAADAQAKAYEADIARMAGVTAEDVI